MEIDTALLASIPIVVALVGVLRTIPFIKERPGTWPGISLLVGVVMIFLWQAANGAVTDMQTFAYSVLQGIVVGLSASGLYSTGKDVVAAVKGRAA